MDEPELRMFVAQNPGTERLRGNTTAASDGDMGMEWFQVRLQVSLQNGILDMMMQGKKVWMPFANADPNYRRLSAGLEKARALERKKERRNAHLAERRAKVSFMFFADIAQKAQGQVEEGR